ncbi:hypothetical protein SAMN05216192_14125 [Paenibacillus typhae]|uniref:Uncharacterized protein n=1 Tax=Paenibacillus typhae TaxID=1174501 RepID=A0A1G9BRT5_9BACL|nr:hypothetical protein SAMN05216192_14125 [Paenibacillus typhae]
MAKIQLNLKNVSSGAPPNPPIPILIPIPKDVPWDMYPALLITG